MIIRAENNNDYSQVRAIHLAAFEGPGEATLVDQLRAKATPIISLVAMSDDNNIVGHIMISPVGLSGHDDLNIMGLAPVAVLPEYQNKGFGSEMIRSAIKQCQQLKFDAIVVLGHENYYPRFGFKISTEFSIRCEYDVPAENFMVMELYEGALTGKTGTVKYHPCFANL